MRGLPDSAGGRVRQLDIDLNNSNPALAGSTPPAQTHRPTATPVQHAAGPAGGASPQRTSEHDGHPTADRCREPPSPTRSHCTPHNEQNGSPRRRFPKGVANGIPRFHEGSASGGASVPLDRGQGLLSRPQLQNRRNRQDPFAHEGIPIPKTFALCKTFRPR